MVILRYHTVRLSATAVHVDHKYARQSGGKGQYGHVVMDMEPLEPGNRLRSLRTRLSAELSPRSTFPQLTQVSRAQCRQVFSQDIRLLTLKCTLVDGSYHEVDSSEMAFKIAGSMAFKDGCKKGNPVIMEPIMKVVVNVPEEYMGDVMGDINSRRGQIQGMEARTGAQEITANVPLSEMFGYATELRSRTQGRGQYSMEPSHFEELPKSIAEKIIKERSKTED